MLHARDEVVNAPRSRVSRGCILAAEDAGGPLLRGSRSDGHRHRDGGAGDVSSEQDHDNSSEEQQECDSEGEPCIYIYSTVE